MRYFVIAENYHQALDWTTRNKQRVYEEHGVQPGEMQYLQSADNLRGIQNPRGIFVGTWYKRKDIKEILIQLSVSMTDVDRMDPINTAWKYLNESR